MNKFNGVPILKDLVLIGGGHSHIAVLRSFGMRPIDGVRLTLVSPESHTAYSGMLPGLIAGHYSFDDAHIDLAKLSAFAGARFLRADVTGLDPKAKTIGMSDRPSISYDVVSINTGSRPPIFAVTGAQENALPVKPVGAFLARWQQIETDLEKTTDPKRVAVVGAGAGGLELAMAIRHRFREKQNIGVQVFEAATDILPGFVSAVRDRVRKNLAAMDIETVTGQAVARVSSESTTLADGSAYSADYVLWTTGATAPSWFRDTGLELDGRGFLSTRSTLQCQPFDDVFAVGDCATLKETPRPKAGVFAVRQGPVLAKNLRNVLLRRAIQHYRPQKRFLTILAMGRQRAVAVKGPIAVEGDWVWRWKNRIDSAFMEKFSVFPPMQEHPPTDRLPSLPAEIMHCAGCGSKLPALALTRALDRLGITLENDIGEDAAIFDPPAGQQLAVSVDYFPAILDDPYIFGKIAANHALGDLYATGARPLSALAIATVPWADPRIAEDDLFQLLSGSLSVFETEGVRLLGGHSKEGDQMALGFSVTGSVGSGEALAKGGVQAGNALILTKPLGTGVIFAAAAQGKAKGRWLDAAIASMTRSVAPALSVLKDHGVTGLTDVTGFGLAGHLGEMLDAAQLSAVLDRATIPALGGAMELLDSNIESSLAPANRECLVALIGKTGATLGTTERLICDPQTAGGLLASIPFDRSKACLEALHEAGDCEAVVIGRVEKMLAPTPRLYFD